MNKYIASMLTFKKPTANPAQTSYDHEEYARFYLELLTDAEYQKFNITSNAGWGPKDLRPWDDAELIRLARQHTEAAKILKELDALHAEDEDGA